MKTTIPLEFKLRQVDKLHRLKQDLEELFLLILDAHCAYEIWWILVEKRRRKQYSNILFSFKEFFEPVIRANSTAMLIALYKLYDERNDTLNFIRILKDAEQLKIIDRSKVKFKRKLSEVRALWKKICILRNNVLAHRNYNMTVQEIYKLANITPNKIKRMIDLSLRLYNSVWIKIEEHSKQLEEYTYMDTIKLLEALKNCKYKV